MPRKGKKRTFGDTNNLGTRADWKPDEEHEVLAWLDYNLHKYGNTQAFEESIVGHLKRKYNVDYNYSQIKRKLYLLWRSYGETPSKPSAIYQKGSDCLACLSPEEKDLIYKRVMELTDRDVAETLNPRRRLRSASETVDFERRYHIDPGTLATKRRGTRWKQVSDSETASLIVEPNETPRSIQAQEDPIQDKLRRDLRKVKTS